MRKRKTPCQSFDFTSTISEKSPLGFPKGSIIKGNVVPFQDQRASLRPGQLVVTRTASGGTVTRFCHQTIISKVVAVVRTVVLPTRPKILLSSSTIRKEVAYEF